MHVAALMTRGLGEIARLGEALGASRNNFYGAFWHGRFGAHLY